MTIVGGAQRLRGYAKLPELWPRSYPGRSYRLPVLWSTPSIIGKPDVLRSRASPVPDQHEAGNAAETGCRHHSRDPDVEKKLSIEAFPESNCVSVLGIPTSCSSFRGYFFSCPHGAPAGLPQRRQPGHGGLRRVSARRPSAPRWALSASGLSVRRSPRRDAGVHRWWQGLLLGVFASSVLSHLDLHADLPVKFVSDFDWRIFFYSLAMVRWWGWWWASCRAAHCKGECNTGFARGHPRVASGLALAARWPGYSTDRGSLVLLAVAALFGAVLPPMRPWIWDSNPDHVTNLASIDSHQIGLTDGEARDLAANITARLHQLAGEGNSRNSMTGSLTKIP